LAERKKQSMLNGAFILVVATMLVKVIGAFYKMPLTALIGEVGRGYFNSAYEIYTPIYAISMAGLPIAVSKMVSQQMALRRYRDVRMVKRVAARIFLITGIVGTLILLGLAFPYANFVTKSPDTLASVLAIAPSIFFCCVMSTYRGYYEGLSNMTPTAISQVIEALGKLVVGLALAFGVVKYGMAQFNSGAEVIFGKVVSNEAEALSAIYPYSSAAAILGVTLGTIASFVFLVIRHKTKGDAITKEELLGAPEPLTFKETTKMLISLAIPMVLSSLVLNITNLIDTTTIQNRLAYAIETDLPTIKGMYEQSLLASGTLDKDIARYLYGVYGAALDFKNLIPTITMALGVSALPALSAAWAVKDEKQAKITIESVMRITMLIAMPAGIGMAVLAEPILTIIYGGSDAQNLIPIAAPIMSTYGYAIFLFALSTPITNMLQAIGRADIPLKAIVAGAVVKIICNYFLVGTPSININGAAIGSIICYVIVVLCNLISLIRLSGVKLNFLSVFIKPTVAAALCGVAAWVSNGLLLKVIPTGDMSSKLNGVTISAVIAIGIAVIVYVFSLLLLKGISKDDLEMIPKGKKIAKVLEKFGFIG